MIGSFWFVYGCVTMFKVSIEYYIVFDDTYYSHQLLLTFHLLTHHVNKIVSLNSSAYQLTWCVYGVVQASSTFYYVN